MCVADNPPESKSDKNGEQKSAYRYKNSEVTRFAMTINKSSLVLLILLAVLLNTGCGGGSGLSNPSTSTTTSVPTAAFTFSPSSPVVGQTVTFTDTSTGSPTSWSWSFGDGATSASQNPTHAYSAAGSYTVTLTATDAAGSSKPASQAIAVAGAKGNVPTAAFIFSTMGEQVNFMDTSTGNPTSWSWSFGDGATSTTQNATHTYSAAGTFTVSLTVAGPTGSSSPVSQTVTVTAESSGAPAAAFTFAPSPPGVGQMVAFMDESTNKPTSWSWSFGDGTTSASQNPTHAYSAVGSYMVTLTATNADGSNAGSQNVSVTKTAATTPTAAFSFSPNPPTAGEIVTFTDTSKGSPTAWFWNFGDSSTNSSSSSEDPAHVYSAAGSYTVTLVAANSAGSSSPEQETVVVSPSASAPTAAFFIAPAAPAAAQTVVFTDISTGGPTSWSWTFSDDGSTSVEQFPIHIYSAAGTYQVALTATNALGSSTVTQSVMVGAALPPSTNTYTLAYSLTDVGQETTLAFDGFAMVTGNLQAQSFFPPGKVADYTGFQYLRDNDPDNMGHDTNFMTNIANNVLYILNDDQLAQLQTLAIAQQYDINEYAYKRYTLMKAFRRLIDGDIPTGSTGLNLDAVKQASNELYLIDGQLAFERALLYPNIYSSMDSSQFAYLNGMVGEGSNSWPVLTSEQLDSINAKMSGLPNGVVVAMMTYAGDIFSWYAGSVDADVYFCPERHGTYYGGFYIKDAPAMNVPGYNISETLTSTAGSALSASSDGYVTPAQAEVMDSLVNTQRNNLYAGATNIVLMRTEIATLLRSLRTSTANSAIVEQRVLALSGIYGNLDGENNYNYATVFAQVYNTLTSDQMAQLAALRKSILTGTYASGTLFDFTDCATYFLYSAAITDTSVLYPYVADTDYLFFEP